jgi:ABC-type histidine transport system ATPase subunit
MIIVEDIYKSFGKVKALRGVSFDAPDGPPRSAFFTPC